MFVELNQKQRIPLEIGQLYLLGKQSNGVENKSKHFIELEAEEEIEQKHCVIDVGHSEDVYVYDLFSLKGSLLNNKPLKALEKIRLQNGDILKVGKQEIKYCHEQPEVSHDSSGFLEVNKNTSDIIASSPDSTSQTESRLKRNYNNFLVPTVPTRKSTTSNTSLVIPETEALSISRNSLNNSSTSLTSNNNRRSDSFTIPETQYCKPRHSLNASDLSVAESLPEDNGNKIKYNFDNLNLEVDDDDDDFCIPETQEVIPSSQRPRLLSNVKEKSILLEESSKTNDQEVDGSQFRICTQDYNEGFGEEAEAMQSQIIPLIKHNTVLLSTTNNTTQKSNNESLRNLHSLLADEEEDKELSAVKWSDSKNVENTTASRADCSTPDIFEFADIEQAQEAKETEKDKLLKETIDTAAEIEDEEDLMPTQAFPLSNDKTTEKKSLLEQDKPCLDKDYEEVLTLSDKENRSPITLEPITDLPPTQLFATNEVSSARSTASSTSSRNSLNSKLKEAITQSSSANKNKPKSVLDLDLELEDEEDDLLTQAFIPTSKLPSTNSTTSSHKTVTNKCFNSTVLEDKFMAKNPHTFFAEMEKTPIKQTTKTTAPANTFKKPDKEITAVKKTSSVASAISDDLDMLMCTPQFIKEHVFLDKNEDLKKNILAAKNRNLFGEDTDDDSEDKKEQQKSDENDDLVMLFNDPKDTLDFEKLLPHLNRKSLGPTEVKKEENTAKEANKLHKFNQSFGQEQDEKRKSLSKSSTVSRDERHSARDKEKELAEHKELAKNKGTSSNNRRGRKPKETEQNSNTSNKETDSEKQISIREQRKRHAKDDDKSGENKKLTKLEETNKKEDDKNRKSDQKTQKKNETKEANLKENNKKENKQQKSTNKVRENNEKEQKSTDKPEPNKRHTRAAKTSVSTDECVAEEKPARRITRAKSRADDSSTTSKESNVKSKQYEETEDGDELDSIATQPFVVRLPRRCSTAKQSESQSSITSNSSRKSTHNNKSKNDTNTSANGSITSKTTGERKRKAEPTPSEVPAKVERKRLRSTHSQESSTTSNTNYSTSSNKILISMTMVDHEHFKGLVENARGIWQVAKDPIESEILVMDKAFRTFKFLLAMARGIPIVTSEYLKKLNQTNSQKKVKIADYLFKDEEFEKKHKCSLIKSQQIAKKHKLFKGYEFVMTANILPNPKEIQAIILASGGFVHAKTPPAPKDNQHVYLITCKEDKKEWHKHRRLNSNIIIISTEAIMSAIMRQSCESLSNYTLA